MNELALLDEAERLLSDAGSNPGNLAFQQSAIAQALGLAREFFDAFRVPGRPPLTGFVLSTYGLDYKEARMLCEHSFENPWSPQAKADAIRALGGLIRAISDAEEFKSTT